MIKQLPLFQEEPDTRIDEILSSPKDYTYIVFFSGGKDSAAMALYLLELGVPPAQIHLHHHDVDGHAEQAFDWPCTPSYCQAFANAFSMPLYFSYREGGIMREIMRTDEGLQDVLFKDQPGSSFVRLESRPGNSTRHKFPAVAADLMSRWCSAVVKIDVGSRVISNHPAYQGRQKLVVTTGERRQESPGRARYKELETHRSSSVRRPVIHWRPVIDWKEDQVWHILRRHRVHPHPAYMLGWGRCSCATCIFSSPNTWKSLYELAPQMVQKLADKEQEINHTIYHTKKGGTPLMQHIEKGVSFLKEENVRRWKSEALGEFTSPIIIDEWTYPQGAFSSESGGSA